MKKLIIKILLLFAVLWAANNMLFHFFHLPYLWGVGYDKQSYYEYYIQKYNTIMLGSSLTGRQIDPETFDSVNGINSVYTRSFNFGLDFPNPVETFFIFKKIIEYKPLKLKYIFAELPRIEDANLPAFHTLRLKSFFGVDQFSRRVPLILSADKSFFKKMQLLSFDVSHLVENEFKIGMLEDVYKFKQLQGQKPVVLNEGYQPLNSEDTSGVIFFGKKYRNPHQKFMSESLPEFRRDSAVATTLFSDPAFLHNAPVNREYANIVSEMLQMAAAKNIRLIFVLPPRLSEVDYKGLLPIYYSIPASNRIQMADGNQYPEFYLLKYSYDLAHLNVTGSEIYTAKLADNFLKLNQVH